MDPEKHEFLEEASLHLSSRQPCRPILWPPVGVAVQLAVLLMLPERPGLVNSHGNLWNITILMGKLTINGHVQ